MNQGPSARVSTDASSILFEAEIKPHRSLSTRGLAILASALGLTSFGVTLFFYSLGAWPVAGFNGAEVLLVLLLIRAHVQGARARELLVLSESGFHIHRTDARGRIRERFLPSAWARIDLEERPGRVPALYLASHGRRIEVASDLGEAQKLDLAEALRQALHAARNPVFDNPQLRDSDELRARPG